MFSSNSTVLNGSIGWKEKRERKNHSTPYAVYTHHTLLTSFFFLYSHLLYKSSQHLNSSFLSPSHLTSTSTPNLQFPFHLFIIYFFSVAVQFFLIFIFYFYIYNICLNIEISLVVYFNSWASSVVMIIIFYMHKLPTTCPEKWKTCINKLSNWKFDMKLIQI